ncbi:hypothetical protein BH23BAC1_BH23BAC1_20380 [soil metagenome]
MNRLPEYYFLLFLHLLLGYNGLVGGAVLIIKPNGYLLGLNKNILDQSPFQDYLIPGTLLFFFFGLIPILILIGLIAKPAWKWANVFNINPDKHWSWTYSLFTGINLIIWITIQLSMVRYFWLQPVMISFGLLIIIFTMMPRVIHHNTYLK